MRERRKAKIRAAAEERRSANAERKALVQRGGAGLGQGEGGCSAEQLRLSKLLEPQPTLCACVQQREAMAAAEAASPPAAESRFAKLIAEKRRDVQAKSSAL